MGFNSAFKGLIVLCVGILSVNILCIFMMTFCDEGVMRKVDHPYRRSLVNFRQYIINFILKILVTGCPRIILNVFIY